jgi:hypothetical protein
MPTYYDTQVSFTATFQVQCELCNHSFAYEERISCHSAENRPFGLGYLTRYSALEKADEIKFDKIMRLESGNYGDVQPRKCPNCGYLQSWMIRKAKENIKLPYLILSGLVFLAGTILFWDSKGEYVFDSVELIMALIMIAIAAIGYVIVSIKLRKINPNKVLLQGRPALEIRKPQISIKL